MRILVTVEDSGLPLVESLATVECRSALASFNKKSNQRT